MIVFSIFKKIFLKIESLMYALRAHINRTHIYMMSLLLINKYLVYCEIMQYFYDVRY